MDQLSEDILILIFRIYLEEPSTMPIFLATVDRRWYNLTHATPVLWSRVSISTTSNAHMALIVSSRGFQQYLSRTDGPDINIPLDIELRCGSHDTDEHETICGPRELKEPDRCLWRSCPFSEQRKELVDAILTLLAGPESSPSTSNLQAITPVYSSGTSEIPSQPPKLRIQRWRSFLFEWGGPTQESLHTQNEYWTKNSFICAPLLTYITLRNVPARYEPSDVFAPNLQYLALRDFEMTFGKPFRLINSPNLKVLSLKSDGLLLWDRLSGTCNVEELSIIESTTEVFSPVRIILPRLRKLTISPKFCFSFAWAITQQFQDAGRRLEELHLKNYTSTWINSAANTALFTDSRKVMIEYSPEERQILAAGGGPGREVDIRRCLKRFIVTCASDTEVVGIDEVHEKALAEARQGIRRE